MHFLKQITLLIMSGLFAGDAFAAPVILNNLPMHQLHTICFYVCCVIGVATFSVLIYAQIQFRQSGSQHKKHFHAHLGVELLWTVIPTAILIALLIPATMIFISPVV